MRFKPFPLCAPPGRDLPDLALNLRLVNDYTSSLPSLYYCPVLFGLDPRLPTGPALGLSLHTCLLALDFWTVHYSVGLIKPLYFPWTVVWRLVSVPEPWSLKKDLLHTHAWLKLNKRRVLFRNFETEQISSEQLPKSSIPKSRTNPEELSSSMQIYKIIRHFVIMFLYFSVHFMCTCSEEILPTFYLRKTICLYMQLLNFIFLFWYWNMICDVEKL